jgi:hypothetical protein
MPVRKFDPKKRINESSAREIIASVRNRTRNRLSNAENNCSMGADLLFDPAVSTGGGLGEMGSGAVMFRA